MGRRQGASTIRSPRAALAAQAPAAVTPAADAVERRRTYSVSELAAMLGVSDDTLYREIRETGTINGVPVVRIRSRLIIPRHLADRLLQPEAGAA